LVLKDKENDKD